MNWSRAWGGFVFGSIAVIALALIAFVLSTPGRRAPNAGPLVLTPVPTSAATPAPSPHHSPTRSASRARTPSPTATSRPVAQPVAATSAARPTVPTQRPRRPRPPRTSAAPAGPCARNAPCVVDGSASIASALDRYRRRHGAAGGVPVVVGSGAQRCAATAGDGPSCAQPYSLAYEPQQDGDRAIADIGAGSGNWLLDPRLGSVEAGWAYLPRTGQYVCVLIEHT